MKRLIRNTLGVLFIILGLAGLVLPFLQGILFLAIGALLLSPDIKFFAKIENYISRRAPRVGRAIKRLKKRFPILVT